MHHIISNQKPKKEFKLPQDLLNEFIGTDIENEAFKHSIEADDFVSASTFIQQVGSLSELLRNNQIRGKIQTNRSRFWSVAPKSTEVPHEVLKRSRNRWHSSIIITKWNKTNISIYYLSPLEVHLPNCSKKILLLWRYKAFYQVKIGK